MFTEPQALDVLLFRPAGAAGFLERTISGVTDSPYTHAAVAVSDSIGIEAWWTGVRRFWIADRVGAYIDAYRYTPGLSDGQIQSARAYCSEHVGEDYNFAALPGFVLEKLGIVKHNPFAHKKRVICSQFVADAYAAMGVPLKKPESEVVPGDFARMFDFHLVGTVKRAA